MENKNEKILRPWGEYVVLEEGENYWLKKIFVRQGARTSLQSHKNRSEVWVVFFGKIEVVKGDARFELGEGDFLKIEKEEKHRITGLAESCLLEAAFGQPKEEDIIRFEDDYGRA